MFGSDNNIVSDYEDLEIVVGQADVTSSLVFWDVSSSLIFGDVSSSLIFGDVSSSLIFGDVSSSLIFGGAASSLIFGNQKSKSSLTFGEHDPLWYLRKGSSVVFKDWNPPQAVWALEPAKIIGDLDPLWYIEIGLEQKKKKKYVNAAFEELENVSVLALALDMSWCPRICLGSVKKYNPTNIWYSLAMEGVGRELGRAVDSGGDDNNSRVEGR